MSISLVAKCLEKTQELRESPNVIKSEFLSRAMSLIIIPVEVVALVVKVVRLIFADCIGKLCIKIARCFGNLKERLKKWDDQLSPVETSRKIGSLTGGLLSSLLFSWSVPKWNYTIHEEFNLTKMKKNTTSGPEGTQFPTTGDPSTPGTGTGQTKPKTPKHTRTGSPPSLAKRSPPDASKPKKDSTGKLLDKSGKGKDVYQNELRASVQTVTITTPASSAIPPLPLNPLETIAEATLVNNGAAAAAAQAAPRGIAEARDSLDLADARLNAGTPPLGPNDSLPLNIARMLTVNAQNPLVT